MNKNDKQPQSKLMKISYYDPKAEVRLTNYADTLIFDAKNTLAAIRFGGYPESVKAMTDAIYGGCGIDVLINGLPMRLYSLTKQYRRQVSHDGIYAEATLLVNDDEMAAANADNAGQGEINQPRRTFIFCERDNPKALFEELDRKTSVPLIPEFQDYFLEELQKRKILKQLTVISLREKFDAWVLESTQDDKPLISVIDEGLKNGSISIPGAVPTNAFNDVSSVSQYLKTFGVTVANRIKSLFKPLFDPATEQLSQEVLSVNEYMKRQTGYSLYDAQLAVAESLKRQLDRSDTAFTVAECGSGKTKIGSAALYAYQQSKHPGVKAFNVVLCPSHITKKWMREVEETLPDTFAGVITNPLELDAFYAAYERDNKTAFAIISKEMARDGYMKQPAVAWSRLKKAFVCPDCGETVMMELTEDGSKYRVKADQFFFMRETDQNHKCEKCKTPLWSALTPVRQTEWVKIGDYGFVHRYHAYEHLKGCKDPGAYEQIKSIAEDPNGYYPASGAYRRMALSTYIKHKLKGRLDGVILDEMHQYTGVSGQGDAMAELAGAAKKVIGMTATLINGYSKGMFYINGDMRPELVTVAELATNWLMDFKRFSVSPRTFEWYLNLTKMYITPALGQLTVFSVQTIHVQRLLNNLLDKGRAVKTVKSVQLVVRQLFAHAYEMKLITENPATKTKLQRYERKSREEQMKAIPIDYRSRILAAAETQENIKPIITTLMFSGLRSGELIALKWKHIDFETRTISVDGAVTVDSKYDREGRLIKKESVLSATKTVSGFRTIRVSSRVTDVLKQWQESQSLIDVVGKRSLVDSDCFVFPTKTGEMRAYSGFRSLIRRFLDSNGFKGLGIHAHSFRHTFATILLENNVNPRVVQLYLGHNDIQTTLNTYSSVTAEVFDKTAKQIDGVYDAIVQGSYEPLSPAVMM